MKQFEILRELLIYDTETKTEQMLLGKWHQQTYLRQGYQQPSVCKNTRSAKRGKAKRDKTRWVCTRPAVRCPWPQAVALTGIYNHVSGEWMNCHKLRGLGKDFFFFTVNLRLCSCWDVSHRLMASIHSQKGSWQRGQAPKSAHLAQMEASWGCTLGLEVKDGGGGRGNCIIIFKC